MGDTGSGKTSLLLSLLGELVRQTGDPDPVTANRMKYPCAFCAQRPILFTGSIRDNVVNGQGFEPKLYHEAIKAVGLDADLQQV